MKSYSRCVLLLLVAVVWLAGCAGKIKENKGQTYQIYYLNPDETGMVTVAYTSETTDTTLLVDEILEQMTQPSEKMQYKATIPREIRFVSYTLTDDQLLLDFGEEYRSQPITTEVLRRAAIVRTLTQIDGIHYLTFQINEQPLADSYGSAVGIMSPDMFIDNEGNEINTYEKTKLLLYFANEDGTGLTPVNRTVYSSSNISRERLVVEQLLLGPQKGEKGYPIMNPKTKVISVNVKDGICYVDLDHTFLTQLYNVTAQTVVYSITNSLVELANVNKVQISVDGNTNINYKENIDFSMIFERNLELIKE